MSNVIEFDNDISLDINSKILFVKESEEGLVGGALEFTELVNAIRNSLNNYSDQDLSANAGDFVSLRDNDLSSDDLNLCSSDIVDDTLKK